jgi:hypothetical protein
MMAYKGLSPSESWMRADTHAGPELTLHTEAEYIDAALTFVSPPPSSCDARPDHTYGTAQAMGYTGPASGLLDANTNLAYAVPYLANAYKVAGGNPDRTVSYYSGGYYYAAKRKGLLRELRSGPTEPVATGSVSSPSQSLASLISSVFTPSQTR